MFAYLVQAGSGDIKPALCADLEKAKLLLQDKLRGGNPPQPDDWDDWGWWEDEKNPDHLCFGGAKPSQALGRKISEGFIQKLEIQ